YGGVALRPMIAALLSDEMPPPRPSIWRPSGAGLPSAVRIMLSRVTWSYGGITSSRKNTARLVPPPINTAGNLCWMAVLLLFGLPHRPTAPWSQCNQAAQRRVNGLSVGEIRLHVGV